MKIWLPNTLFGSFKEGGGGGKGRISTPLYTTAMKIWLPNILFGSFKEGGVFVGGISTPLYTTSYENLVSQYPFW